MISMKKSMVLKTLVGAICLMAVPFSGALAGDFPARPASYEAKAVNYIESRLSDPIGASIRQASEPYQVMAQLNGKKEYACWAVDFDVRADMGSASRGSGTYTVLFYNGTAVALSSDLRSRLTRVTSETLIAQN